MSEQLIPDLDWRFTDRAGHEHRWSGGADSYTVSTLILVVDKDGESVLACAQCGEVVVPGFRQDDKCYVIWSFEHRAWWGRDECGYTRDLEQAGLYSIADAGRIVVNANMVREEERALPWAIAKHRGAPGDDSPPTP